MKKISLFITAIVIALLIAPKFIGGVVETEYQSALDKLALNPAIEINSTTFSRDWFGGKATAIVTILLHDDEIDDIKLTVEDDLSFGPIIFTDNGVEFALSYSHASINFKELILDDEIADFINDKIHLTGLLTFSKDIVSTIVIDEVSKEVDGNTIVSAKAVGEFVLENETRVYGEFHWGGLSANTSDEKFTIGETTFSLDQTIIAGDYYQGNAISTGDFNFTIAAINSSDAMGNEIVAIQNIVIAAIASVDNDLMKISLTYGADEMKSAGQHLKNANLKVVVDKLDVKTMQEVNTMFTSLSTDSEEMFSEENMAKISPLLTKVLANDPIIAIEDLSVETSEGKIESAMEVTIDKNTFDVNNLMSIMAAVNADANGKAPLAFFEKLGLAPMIDAYVEQGLLIKTEQELSFKANFSQGQLQVNGQVIPL